MQETSNNLQILSMTTNSNKILITILSATSLLLFGLLLANDLNSKKNDRNLINLPTTTPNGIPAFTPTPAHDLTLKEQMVNCNIDINCGGGTKFISKETCLNLTCCLLGEKFVIYDDKNKCLHDQAILNGSNSASFTPVSQAVYVSVYNAYIYCKPEVISQIKQQDKLVREWMEKIKLCSSGAQYDYSNCLKNCTDINSWQICSQDCRDKSNISSCDAFRENPLNSLNAIINANCG